MGTMHSPYGDMGSPGSSNGSIKARKNKEDKICGVCGDRALGYNFDAISCESCKAFFRRNAPKGLDYFKCPYDEKCKMDISNRRFCKRCRLRKCFEIGMRKEYILTDEEKQRKKQKIEENRYGKQMMQAPQIGYGMMRDLERQGIIKTNEVVTSQARPLAPEDHQLITEIRSAYFSSLEINMDKELPRDNANSMVDLANIAEVSVRMVIAMSKKIDSFKGLPQPDQISLLKGGSIELLILRSVITFDRDKQHFLDPVDTEEKSAMNLDQLEKAEGSGLFRDHMKFVKTLALDLKADETTLILLLVISLFSPDRPNVLNKLLVSQEQDRYSMLLQRYLDSIYPYPISRTMYPRLLMKLTDIRNLNEEHSQVLLKVNPEGIQPLMQEVLDLRS
eukprot:GHVU01208200.1.p1 GENE.GHVU01208200.1~~GHVU01208200.1.p1  ORF type:complete len:460 (+),score=60.28 GHVU01208200.1:210-1382(+)